MTSLWWSAHDLSTERERLKQIVRVQGNGKELAPRLRAIKHKSKAIIIGYDLLAQEARELRLAQVRLGAPPLEPPDLNSRITLS